ncbi:PAS domain-containing sensor histidine kinase [Rufibacter immobilis]|nr:PAS domain S-box protein [Rufibacter immobilis]
MIKIGVEGVVAPKGKGVEVDMGIMSALVENSPEPILLLTPEGEILYVNEAMCQLVGRDKESLLQLGREALRDQEDPRWQLVIQEREQSGYSRRELNMVHQDGTKIPVEVSSRLFAAPSGQELVSVHVRDQRSYFAAQRQIQHQKLTLQDNLHDLQRVLDYSADLITSFRLDGTLLHINKASIAILGYTPEEMLGRNYREFIHPEDLLGTEDHTDLVQEKLLTTHFRNRYIHKNGSVVHLSWVSAYSAEVNRTYCIGREISQVLEQEKYQLESEQRLQALLLQGTDMIAILSPDGGYIFASANTERILGVPASDFLIRNAFDFVHPEDIPAVRECFEQVLSAKEVNTKPFRFKDAQGHWRWVESYITNCLDIPTIKGIVVNSRDITDRVQQEILLRESEQRYKALFHYNPNPVYSLDLDGNFVSVNQAGLGLLQVSLEEAKKLNFRILSTPESLEQDELEFQKVLRGEPVTRESSLVLPDRIMYYTFTEMPIVIDGQVVGVHGIVKDITQAKEQQMQLEASSKRMNNILESIKDAFFTVDTNLRFTYVNQVFENIMGVRKEDILGVDVRDVYSEKQYATFYAYSQKGLETGCPVHFEEFSAADNLWLDVSVYPSEEGLSIFMREINSRKNAEAELKKLSLVASKTVNSVCIIDQEGRVEWVNDGFMRITGYSLEEIKGQRPIELLPNPETTAEVVPLLIQNFAGDDPFVQEVQCRSKTGDVYWSRLDVTPFWDEQNGQKKHIVIETIITEEKKAEEVREKLTEELLTRNRNLEQFTYIVSHNLRSPVANILGLTSLLGTSDKPELQEGLVSRLKLTAQNLDQIIRDLNEMLSLQAGITEEAEKFQLPKVIEQALQVLPAESFEKLTVNLNGVKEIGSIKSYVSSIINNLLTNAVKYKSPDRPLHLAITAELHPEKEMLCLAVSDNGLGINLEKEGKNMFGLYKRFHFHVSGRGLGLYLVRTQAEALGGYVTVESALNEGSTFKVWIKNFR